MILRNQRAQRLKKIELQNKQSRQFTIVDDADYPELSKYEWHSLKCRTSTYAVRYEKANGKWKTIRMHRQLMQPPPGMEVDHRNTNSLDNRRFNLRICTHLQNVANIGPGKRNTSGYKGVNFVTRLNKWQAGITVAGKSRYLGCYGTALEAAKAYDDASFQLYGEFAHLNLSRETG